MDKESQANQPLSEMERGDYIDKINSLSTAINQFKESYSL
ncbi:hypothetical protein M115_3863 [Bacteroides fragilis str. 3719 T6]|nr:hypothetical protein M144_1542 [Bacteroides fragilis str. 3-F-2 \